MKKPEVSRDRHDGELYRPPAEILENANVKEYERLYEQSIKDPERFWGERARELEWFRPWDSVLDRDKAPFFKWFVGGMRRPIEKGHCSVLTEPVFRE